MLAYRQGQEAQRHKDRSVSAAFPRRPADRASDRPDQQALDYFYTLAERDLNRPSHRHLLCYHPRGLRIQSIEALACVLEIEALLKDILFLQSIQGIPYGPWRKIRLSDDILLREKAP